MKDILLEIIDEAKKGYVNCDDDFPICFDTIRYDETKEEKEKREEQEKQYIKPNYMSTLIIKDTDKLVNILEKYLELELSMHRKCYRFLTERSLHKFIIASLFVNATTEDFTNPVEFVKRRINFLKDQTFNYLNNGTSFNLGNKFYNTDLTITNNLQGITMETPYRMDFTISKDIDGTKGTYKLPSVSYAISEINGTKVCYIYSILKDKDKELPNEDKQVTKKINRLLYKLNSNIVDESEESILDVSPSQVMSISLFISLLKKEDINEIYVVPYLPLRYLSRELAITNINDESRKQELIERSYRIQDNSTNKFIRTFMRAAYHIDGLEIISTPYELDEYMHLSLDPTKTKVNNELLSDVTSHIKK